MSYNYTFENYDVDVSCNVMNYLYNVTSNYVEHWKSMNIHDGEVLGSISL